MKLTPAKNEFGNNFSSVSVSFRREMKWQHDEGQRDQESLRGKSSSERVFERTSETSERYTGDED